VAVDDWSPHADKAQLLREHFARTYHDREDHRHIHGANLGVCALAYQAAGGFAAVACHEDVLLVRALPGARCRVCSPAPGWMRGRAVASGIRCWP